MLRIAPLERIDICNAFNKVLIQSHNNYLLLSLIVSLMEDKAWALWESQICKVQNNCTEHPWHSSVHANSPIIHGGQIFSTLIKYTHN
jgi:hypothetical protein